MRDLSMKAARVEKGYTQEAIAEKLGISKRAYVSWELGEVTMKPYMIFSLAYILEMDADQIRVPVNQ